MGIARKDDTGNRVQRFCDLNRNFACHWKYAKLDVCKPLFFWLTSWRTRLSQVSCRAGFNGASAAARGRSFSCNCAVIFSTIGEFDQRLPVANAPMAVVLNLADWPNSRDWKRSLRMGLSARVSNTSLHLLPVLAHHDTLLPSNSVHSASDSSCASSSSCRRNSAPASGTRTSKSCDLLKLRCK